MKSWRPHSKLMAGWLKSISRSWQTLFSLMPLAICIQHLWTCLAVTRLKVKTWGKRHANHMTDCILSKLQSAHFIFLTALLKVYIKALFQQARFVEFLCCYLKILLALATRGWCSSVQLFIMARESDKIFLDNLNDAEFSSFIPDEVQPCSSPSSVKPVLVLVHFTNSLTSKNVAAEKGKKGKKQTGSSGKNSQRNLKRKEFIWQVFR